MNKEEIEELKDFTIDLTDIDELALGLEVCSKKSNMVIQEFVDTIIQLQQENKILKENAENNDKVVDKVNWENMFLKKENKQLQEELECTIGIVEHNRIISEKNKEIHQLKDNWIKLKEYIRKNIIYDDVGMKILDPSPLEDYMQELERSDSNE